MSDFYNDYYDLFERFSIMTIDGKTPAESVFKFLSNRTTPELLSKLKKDVEKNAEYNAPAETNQDIKTPAGAGLQNYLTNKIALYPCNQDARPILKIYNDNHEVIKENQITTPERLQEWERKNISLFSFYPAENHLLILDLDNSCDAHANKTNGIENFVKWVNALNLNDRLKGFFKDFPNNFPCYVKTPHDGIHLYFNDIYMTEEIKKGLDNARMNAQNIEIKYKSQCTAGGSVRKGKEYILQGDIKDAPRITLDLLNAMTKERPKTRPARHATYNTKKGDQWNATPDGIINKAMELYSNETPHQFIYKTAVLFQRAGFSKSDAELYIKQTPQHLQRKNQADTETAINSIFK